MAKRLIQVHAETMIINKQINNKQGRTELSQNSWAGNSWGGNAPPEDFLAQYSDAKPSYPA